MASAFITTRKTRSGARRHVVRYRLGGFAFPIAHAGSFKTKREARVRRDLIAGELAAGRNPALALGALAEVPSRRTFAQVAAEYRVSRIDLADNTTKGSGAHFKSFAVFDDRDPATITFADVQQWIASLKLKPGTMRVYMSTLRQVLDFAGVDPNPARDRRVRLPRVEAEELTPPTAKQVLAILGNVAARWRLPFVLMEQTSLEPQPTELLEVGDLDFAENKIRLRRKTVKGQRRVRARELQVPGWLMDAIAATLPPLDDREATARVFPGFTVNGARNAMDRACVAAGIAHFSPYSLRHRRTSLWHGQGVPIRELMARTGHSKSTTTIDVYSHVLIDNTELTAAELLSRCGPRVVSEEE